MTRARAAGVLALCMLAPPVDAATKAPPDVCASEGPAPGPGALEPFRRPAPKALELNAAGKVPYRQGKWDEARAQYRAAEAADPEFLAPRLNVACSFVRQERFAEATAELVALLDRAYVPWAKEIRDAADLGALEVRPEMKEIERAMAAAAARWGAGLEASVVFVARSRPPLRVPEGAGVFILNPHQEVWAYVPRTRRYRQLTAEDGHVVALAPAREGGRLLYVTAETLVRGARPDERALRGVAVRELTLATMTLGPRLPIAGDVRRLAVLERTRPGGFLRAGTALVDVTTSGGHQLFALEGGRLAPAPDVAAQKGVDALVVLTTAGVEPTHVHVGTCDLVASDVRSAGEARVLLQANRGAPVPLAAPEGAGLLGLPIR